MYAEVGRNTFDPSNMPSAEVIEGFQSLLAEQPGYRGYLLIEGQDSHRIMVRMWEMQPQQKPHAQN